MYILKSFIKKKHPTYYRDTLEEEYYNHSSINSESKYQFFWIFIKISYFFTHVNVLGKKGILVLTWVYQITA